MWFIIPLPRREFYWVKSREIRTKRGCIGDRNWFLDFCWGRSLLTAWVALVDSRTRSPKRWKPCSELHHAVMPPKQFYKVKMPTLKIRDFKHSKPYPTKISGFKKSNDPRLFPMRIRHISDGRRAGLLAALGAGAPLLARSGAVAIRRSARGFFIIWPIEIRYFIG